MSRLCSRNEHNLLKGTELEGHFVKVFLDPWLGFGFYTAAL